MGKVSSNLLADLDKRELATDPRMQIVMDILAAIAANIWQSPSIRIQATRDLATLYQKIPEKQIAL